MSFNAKDLTYESKEPSFLRKLKKQYGGSVTERPIARPRKHKDEEADDEPTYVEEGSNNTITKEQYKDMLDGNPSPSSDIIAKNATIDRQGNASPLQILKREVVGTIGKGGKKRSVKAVGDGDELANGGTATATSKDKSKKSPKAKKVKLSFHEEC